VISPDLAGSKRRGAIPLNVPVEFAGYLWQGRVARGYWLTRDFHEWPGVQALTLKQTGLYFVCSIWAACHKTEVILPELVRMHGGAPGAPSCMVDVGLWEPCGRNYRSRTTQELRSGRRLPGQAIAVSSLLPQSLEGIRAGLAGLGVWALAASQSITMGIPGFIPEAVACEPACAAYADLLCAASLWLPGEGGYWMTKGDHPIEERWSGVRDDERAPIPDELRALVYERDEYRCVICGATADLTLDHIYPWSLGGPDTEENLRTLCRRHNSQKGARV